MRGIDMMIFGLNVVFLSDGNVLLLEELLMILQWVKPIPLKEDNYVWWRLKDGFSVKYFYKRICESCSLKPSSDSLKGRLIDYLWKIKVPSKFFIFDWRLIFNMLPTMMELFKLRIIEGAHNIVCPLCLMEERDVEHLFCSSSYSKITWNNFYYGLLLIPYLLVTICWLDS